MNILQALLLSFVSFQVSAYPFLVPPKRARVLVQGLEVSIPPAVCPPKHERLPQSTVARPINRKAI